MLGATILGKRALLSGRQEWTSSSTKVYLWRNALREKKRGEEEKKMGMDKEESLSILNKGALAHYEVPRKEKE